MNVSHPRDHGVACDLCEGGDFQRLHTWDVGNFWNPATIPISVWQCQQCQLVFLHPVPTEAQLPDEGDWWSPKRLKFRRNRTFKKIWERTRRAILGSPQSRLIRATHKAVSQGKLLDVGCGHGALMDAGSKYYECVGVEPSPIATESVRRRGFEVIQATFEDADLPRGAFDVVTMDSVVEHVDSAVGVLKKTNAALRMGGVVMMKTPKFGGPAYSRHGEGWNGFRHGYHTFLFTGATLGGCMEKAGFEVLQSPKRDRMLDDILVLWGKKVREVATEVAKAA